MGDIRLFNIRVSYLLFYFIVYSFIGWLMETLFSSIRKGTFINVGFLIGPFCPIYGFGALLLILLLKPLKFNILFFFVGAIILTSLLEYITSFILETFFKNCWWDYSNLPFNLQGRICLNVSLVWGLISVIMIYLFQPFIHYFITLIPRNIIMPLAGVVILYIVSDALISSASMTGLNLKQIPSEFNSSLVHLKDIIINGIENIKNKLS